MTTAATVAPWQAQIIQQLEQLTADELTGKTHAVVDQAEGCDAILTGLAASEAEALVIAEDESAKTGAGDQTIVKLSDIQDWMGSHTDDLLPVADAPDLRIGEATGEPREGVEVGIGETAVLSSDQPAAGTTEGEDPAKGKLFDVKIKLDPTKPTVLKLAFSGGLELDLENPDDVAFYNRLTAGKNTSLEVTAHVAATKKTHRRDSEGHVDAVVETKSLTVRSIDTN